MDKFNLLMDEVLLSDWSEPIDLSFLDDTPQSISKLNPTNALKNYGAQGNPLNNLNTNNYTGNYGSNNYAYAIQQPANNDSGSQPQQGLREAPSVPVPSQHHKIATKSNFNNDNINSCATNKSKKNAAGDDPHKQKMKRPASPVNKRLSPLPKKLKQSSSSKSVSPLRRTSRFRGVSRHKSTGRYEAYLWDKAFVHKDNSTRRGKQVYLGGYEDEVRAAQAYDLAALKYWGPRVAITNFPVASYMKEMEEMESMSRHEHVAYIRRRSNGFTRGTSKYRGVTKHNNVAGRWQARMGRVDGSRDIYLGTFKTQEEATEAYDIAAIRYRGSRAVTNFPVDNYNVNAILSTPDLFSLVSQCQKDAAKNVVSKSNSAPETSVSQSPRDANENVNASMVSPNEKMYLQNQKSQVKKEEDIANAIPASTFSSHDAMQQPMADNQIDSSSLVHQWQIYFDTLINT